MCGVRSSGRARRRRALYRTEWRSAGQTLQLRRQEVERAHVGRLFLHPEEFARVCMLRECCFQFSFRQRKKLLQEDDGGFAVAAALAFTAQFMADLAAAHDNPL